MRSVVQRVTWARVRVDDEVATGRFRTEMRVELENDGPVTLVVDV